MEYLLSRTQQWSESLCTRHIKPSEAWYCLQSSILKTIKYPLMATTLSRKQLHKVMHPILRDALRKCGIQWNIPRKLLYGTLRSRGLGLQDPFWTQLIHHLQAILRHCHRGTPTSMLLDEGMELVQLYVGSDQTFWELPFSPYGFLVPDCWIKHTWASLKDTSLTLCGPNLVIPIKRKNDVHLMDAFIDQGWSQKVLLALKKCRLYLQATTLADICTADGTLVDSECWHGRRGLRWVPHKQWIHTIDPGPAHWSMIWQVAICQVFLSPDVTYLRLRQPLGFRLQHCDSFWTWWKHPVHNILYRQAADQSWSRRRFHTQQGNRLIFGGPVPVPSDQVPPGLLRASVMICWL
jgi:hypothetical protein